MKTIKQKVKSMKILVKKTCTKIYLKNGHDIFITKNNWNNPEFEKMDLSNVKFEKVDFSKLQKQQIDALNKKYGWLEFEDCNSIREAYNLFIEILINEKKLIKEKSLQRRIEKEKILKENWERIKDLNPIPATLENIRIVINCLHSKDFGLWHLPQMSISYSTNQYDCEGEIATTMKFDKKIEGINKFKVGGKTSHLEKYTSRF
jgi:hypothetical protein